MQKPTKLVPYHRSLAGSLLAAREAVMAPIRPFLRESGVTEQQWRVLRVLSDSGALDASRIAELALLYPPSVTRILRELVDRELISRDIDESDRRRSVICITPQGEELVARTAKHTIVLLNLYRQAFGDERLAALIAELAALSETISGLAPQLEMARQETA